MKKFTLIIIFLIFLTSVSAQSLSIQIINYNSETKNARIQVTNEGSTDFHDVKIKIDDSTEIPFAPVIAAGSTPSSYFIISSGEHTFTLTTREGTTLTKKLYFSPSQEQIKEDIEIKKQIAEEKPKTQTPVEIPKKKFDFRYLYLLLALIIIYWLYKKYKK